MALNRTIDFALTIAIVLCAASEARGEGCSQYGARELAADAKRATQWNWGWGSLYALSSVGGAALAVTQEDEDRKLGLWVGVAKSTLGAAYVLVNPIRIEGPEPDCHGLDEQLSAAAKLERERHGWFPHASALAVNLAAFAYVGYETGRYAFSARFAITGVIAGELAIFTSPNEVRAGGPGMSALHLVPHIGKDSTGFALGGVF